MFEIEIEVSNGWTLGEERLMIRVADVVAGRSQRADHILRKYPGDEVKEAVLRYRSMPWPCRQDDGYDWSLDSSNNWKAQFRGTTLTVAYRYGGGHQEMMEGLRLFLAWNLD